MQGGWALSECGQVGLVLDKKLGWNAFSNSEDKNKDSSLFNNLTITIGIAALGMGFGAYLGGALLPRFGSRKLIIFCNVISLIFNIIKLIESTAAIITARLVYGTAMGIAAVCLARSINDTIPA